MKFNLQRLRFERLSRLIPQERVAEALGISRSYYHKKETGKAKMTIEEFGIIIDVLGIPKNEIINFFTTDVPERERTTA
mgnify:FL=1